MRILETGPGWAALMKPSGIHVHPPENSMFKLPRSRIALYLARDLLGCKVYPVHRLDAGTCGVLLMALDPQTASFLGKSFQERNVRKTYHAVARGWLVDTGRIDVPLDSDSSGLPLESLTSFRTLDRIELDAQVSPRYPKTRYSLVEVEPHTGRYHQIRRHFNRISHPVVGDAVHGDSHHNRFFREKMGLHGLCLKAHRLEFRDPSGGWKVIDAPDDEKWKSLRALFRGETGPFDC